MIRIFDKNDGLLLGLQTVLDLLESVIPDLNSKKWQVTRARSGYGKNVCDLENRLDFCERVPLSIDELKQWLEDGEHFDSIRIECSSESLAFGVEDSTYLFVDTLGADLIRKISENYRETQIIET
jgi:hypothetical protein